MYALLRDVDRRGRAAVADPPRRGRPPCLGPEALRGVVTALGRAERITEVARAFGVAEATVKRVAKRYGLRRPPARASLPALARAAQGVVDMFAVFSARVRVLDRRDAIIFAAAVMGTPTLRRDRAAHGRVAGGLMKRLGDLHHRSVGSCGSDKVWRDLGDWMRNALAGVPAGIAVTFFVYCHPCVSMDFPAAYPGGATAAVRDYWKSRGVRVELCRSERDYQTRLLAWLLRPGPSDPRSYICYRQLLSDLGGHVVVPLRAWMT